MTKSVFPAKAETIVKASAQGSVYDQIQSLVDAGYSDTKLFDKLEQWCLDTPHERKANFDTNILSLLSAIGGETEEVYQMMFLEHLEPTDFAILVLVDWSNGCEKLAVNKLSQYAHAREFSEDVMTKIDVLERTIGNSSQFDERFLLAQFFLPVLSMISQESEYALKVRMESELQVAAMS